MKVTKQTIADKKRQAERDNNSGHLQDATSAKPGEYVIRDGKIVKRDQFVINQRNS